MNNLHSQTPESHKIIEAMHEDGYLYYARECDEECLFIAISKEDLALNMGP